MKKIICMASGRGTNFEALVSETKNYHSALNAKVMFLFTNKSQIRAIDIARNNNIPVIADLKNEDIETVLAQHEFDYLLLLGYMRILPKSVVNKYNKKIINIHPSLLPAFPGLNAQKQAFDYGVKISGCTMHYVDEGVDTGKIISQMAIDISDCDSYEKAAEKILKAEHVLLIKTMAKLCN